MNFVFDVKLLVVTSMELSDLSFSDWAYVNFESLDLRLGSSIFELDMWTSFLWLKNQPKNSLFFAKLLVRHHVSFCHLLIMSVTKWKKRIKKKATNNSNVNNYYTGNPSNYDDLPLYGYHKSFPSSTAITNKDLPITLSKKCKTIIKRKERCWVICLYPQGRSTSLAQWKYRKPF